MPKDSRIIRIQNRLGKIATDSMRLSSAYGYARLAGYLFTRSYSGNRESLTDLINKSMVSLSPHQKEVLELRYGLKDGIGRTMQEVVEELRITRQRIEQIEANAIRKVRFQLVNELLKWRALTVRHSLAKLEKGGYLVPKEAKKKHDATI